MFKLSPTKLAILEDCPRCFWLDVVKGIERPRGAFPSLPSGVDKLLKEHFDRFRDRDDLPPELKEHNINANLFADRALLKKWRNNFGGIEYYDKEHDVLLHSAVDNILEKDGKLIVLDYKTRGFALKEDTSKHYQNQLDIYNFLLRKNGFQTHDYAYLLFYVPAGILETGEFIFKTDLVEMKIDVSSAESLFKRSEEIIKSGMPDPDSTCEYCGWAKKTNFRGNQISFHGFDT